MDPRSSTGRPSGSRRSHRDAQRRHVDLSLRVVALLVFLLTVAGARGADLILLAPTFALGPAVDRDRVLEPNWILWPPAREELIRLLPITTGVDWNLRADQFAVREEGGGFTLLHREEFGARGLFTARAALVGNRRLVPLAREGGALPREAIALCANGRDPVRAATGADLRDPRALIVTIAQSEAAIVRARRSVTGRVLLVEIPRAGYDWSRFYLFDRGWPRESSPVLRGIPGLIPAREVMRLVTRPETFSWTPRDPLRYRESDRWLSSARWGWPTWGIVLFSLGAAAAAFLELARDRRTQITSVVMWAALAFPAAVLVSPMLATGIGPEFAAVVVGVDLLLLVAVAWAFSRLSGERTGVALLAVVGVLAAGWAGPFHPWSGILRDLPRGLSPEEIGAVALYSAVGIATTRDGEGFLWLLVRLANLGALAGLLLRHPETAFVVPLGWAAGMAWLSWSVSPALAALPFGLDRLLRHGVGYRPRDLWRSYPVDMGANLWQVTNSLLSGPTVVFGLSVGFAAMMATPYVGYRLRRAEPGPGRAAVVAAMGLAAACVLTPELWPGVLIAFAGALPLFVADAR